MARRRKTRRKRLKNTGFLRISVFLLTIPVTSDNTGFKTENTGFKTDRGKKYSFPEILAFSENTGFKMENPGFKTCVLKTAG